MPKQKVNSQRSGGDIDVNDVFPTAPPKQPATSGSAKPKPPKRAKVMQTTKVKKAFKKPDILVGQVATVSMKKVISTESLSGLSTESSEPNASIATHDIDRNRFRGLAKPAHEVRVNRIVPETMSQQQYAGDDALTEQNVILKELRVLKNMMVAEAEKRKETEARIQANLDVINEQLAIRNSKAQQKKISVSELMERFPLPILEYHQIPIFEKFLQCNVEYKNDLTSVLSRIGGRNHLAKLRAIMTRVIHDKALQRYTWKGTLTKDPFIQFKHINEVLTGSIHTDDCPYTDHDHNQCMKELCKHAKTRLKTRTPTKKRKQRKRSNSRQNLLLAENESDNVDGGEEEFESDNTDGGGDGIAADDEQDDNSNDEIENDGDA